MTSCASNWSPWKTENQPNMRHIETWSCQLCEIMRKHVLLQRKETGMRHERHIFSLGQYLNIALSACMATALSEMLAAWNLCWVSRHRLGRLQAFFSDVILD